MTDSTQELNEIIEHAYNAGYSAKDMVKQAILDWHNKQVEELLDRLESEVQGIATSKPSVAYATSIPTNKVLYTIAAERNKLKEEK